MSVLDQLARWFGLSRRDVDGMTPPEKKPEKTVDEWREEQRGQWETSNSLLEGIRDAQGGIVTQLDEVLAQLDEAATSAEGARAAAGLAVQLLTEQKASIAELSALVAELQAAGDADLSEVVAKIAAIDENIDAATDQLVEATDAPHPDNTLPGDL